MNKITWIIWLLTLLVPTFTSSCRVVGRPYQGAILSDHQYPIALYWERYILFLEEGDVKAQQALARNIEERGHRAQTRQIDQRSLQTTRRTLSQINKDIRDAEKAGNFRPQRYGFSGGIPQPGAVAPAVPWMREYMEGLGWTFH